MEYILKQFNKPLLKFSATTDTSEPEIQILWIGEDSRSLLPLDLTLTPEGLSRWLRRRTIPKNRAYVHSLLAKCGLNLNRPLSIINICKGLSLNDCYWVVQEDNGDIFEKGQYRRGGLSHRCNHLCHFLCGRQSRQRIWRTL